MSDPRGCLRIVLRDIARHSAKHPIQSWLARPEVPYRQDLSRKELSPAEAIWQEEIEEEIRNRCECGYCQPK